MLQRAGLIELAGDGRAREAVSPGGEASRVGPEIRAAGLATELQAAQLRELQRGFELHGEQGEFRSAQVHAKVDLDTLRTLLNDLIDSINDVEDDENALQTITIAFHPAFEQGEADEPSSQSNGPGIRSARLRCIAGMQARFHGLTFVTDPGRVFTPRAASEKLVDRALARLGSTPARVADVGTGSGAIAVTLALQAPLVEVWAQRHLRPRAGACGSKRRTARRADSPRDGRSAGRPAARPRSDRGEPPVPPARDSWLRGRAGGGRVLERRRPRPLPPAARRRRRSSRAHRRRASSSTTATSSRRTGASCPGCGRGSSRCSPRLPSSGLEPVGAAVPTLPGRPEVDTRAPTAARSAMVQVRSANENSTRAHPFEEAAR